MTTSSDRVKPWLTLANVIFWLGVAAWVPVAAMLCAVWGWGQSLSGALGVRSFLNIGLFFVPAFSLAGYFGGASWSRIHKAAIYACVAGGTLGVTGLVVARVYPGYPAVGPHELVASATVLPAVLLPSVAIARRPLFARGNRASLYSLVLGLSIWAATIAIWGRDIEMRLPWSVKVVHRLEQSDIQDFSNYFLRAESVTHSDFVDYVTSQGLTKSGSKFACGPWSAPENAELWVRDERTSQADTEKYPSGFSGCVTKAAWASDTVVACHVCEWGI